PVEARPDEPEDPARANDPLGSLRELVEDMRNGRVDVLFILGGNPVYSAPADLDFAGAMDRVRLRVHLSPYEDETSERCNWHTPEAHYLEAWGDVRAYDGTTSLIQPLIAPLYGGRSAHELLALLTARPERSSFEVVRAYWRQAFRRDFEARWRQAL